MKNIFVILGPSASGKDTLFNNLVKNNKWKKLVLHSSRPIRKGEVNGDTYHFVDKSYFKDNKDFIQVLEFNDWCYGLHKSELDKIDNVGIVILSIEATKQLIDYVSSIKENYFIYPIFLKVDDDVRLKRLLGRGDSVGEIYRRIEADRIDFKDIDVELNPFIIDASKSISKVTKVAIEYISSLDRSWE